MTSVFLTRRAVLSGGALLGMSALLAACGQQAANEASVSASSSATPSETASASATATESASASATPSPRVTRGYSGNSKAPDGEYRKADGYGPAQNVPEPRKEPAQYPETEDGIDHMMQDWLTAHNYAIQTGDCAPVFRYVEKTSKEYPFYEYIDDLYKRGGWVVDGLDAYRAEGDLIYDDQQKFYRMKVRRFWTTVMYVDSNGKITKQANTNKDDDKFNFFFSYSNGYWKIIGSGYSDTPENNEE
ncbi:DUF6318 family protein [Rothia mucilaginosa]|uniref:Tat pathway signal sequence domain protein n=1 Tax=Rothia mucilaginosa TaxID=43675 RepID=A0A0K2RXM5_9MICC|nr:DUF6318 family protein [Rothia mucilaginosa]BAS19332.1 tat pathway signal sequence domain protein [Rothia mucilaginosa]